jgi:hypothetical protein
MRLDFIGSLGLVDVQKNVYFPGIFASGRSSKFHGLPLDPQRQPVSCSGNKQRTALIWKLYFGVMATGSACFGYDANVTTLSAGTIR